MNKLTSFIIFYIVSSFSAFVFAEEEKEIKQKEEAVKTKKLYRVVDEKGNVSYSDNPVAGAQEVEMKPIQSIKMDKPKVDYDLLEDEFNRKPKRESGDGYYDLIEFVGLENNGVVRNNGGTVTLTAKLHPELSKGHFLIFYIDGKQIGSQQKELTITAENIEYGPHFASFSVVSKDGKKVQQSKKINFALLHTVRKKANNINGAVNRVFNADSINSALPQHPKVPTYESMKKTDNDDS